MNSPKLSAAVVTLSTIAAAQESRHFVAEFGRYRDIADIGQARTNRVRFYEYARQACRSSATRNLPLEIRLLRRAEICWPQHFAQASCCARDQLSLVGTLTRHQPACGAAPGNVRRFLSGESRSVSPKPRACQKALTVSVTMRWRPSRQSRSVSWVEVV